MFKETINLEKEDTENIMLNSRGKELFGFKMVGECTDRIFKNGELIEERVGHNLVVTSFLSLISYMLKNSSGGITYWAVGSGSSGWDTVTPDPIPSATTLTNEIGRIAVSSSDIKFLDGNDEVTNTPTNVIQVKCIFGTDDCNGIWREFGLFGGNATSTVNSGIMMNKRHHSILTKTSDMTVERVMKFTLSLS